MNALWWRCQLPAHRCSTSLARHIICTHWRALFRRRSLQVLLTVAAVSLHEYVVKQRIAPGREGIAPPEFAEEFSSTPAAGHQQLSCSMELPITDKDLISRCRNEYDTAVTAGADTSAAGLRLVWALVHARSTSTDVQRGIQLAELLMDKQDTDPQFKFDAVNRLGRREMQRELVYLRAVGKYRVGKLLEARRQLDELLKVSPDSHQAHQLKQAVEDQIIKEGLVGVGIVGGLLGVGAVILSAAFSRR